MIVEPPEDKTVGSWGTPKVEETREKSAWPRVYRERNAMQALSVKSMLDHGGLDSTHGRKTIRGPDRHPQRKKAHLEASLETAHKRVDKKAEALSVPQDKGAESKAQGPGVRLEQRQGT